MTKKKTTKKSAKSDSVRIELDYRVELGNRDYQGVVVGSKKLTDSLLEAQEKLIKEIEKENN